MMTSILTAISLTLAQPHANVVSAMEQLQTAIAATAIATEELAKQLNAISQQIQESVGFNPLRRIKRSNPFAAIQKWHTAMAILHSAHKQVIYWKRTRAQILEEPNTATLPESVIIIVIAIFI